MNTHEVLVAARNLLERETWVTWAAYGPREFCVYGAITAAVANDDLSHQDAALSHQDAANAFERANGMSPGYGPPWNDKPERTKDEVLAAFDKAIAATAPEPIDPLHGVEVEQPVGAAAV